MQWGRNYSDRDGEISTGFEVTKSGAKVWGPDPSVLAEIANSYYSKDVFLRKDGIVIAIKGARNRF
jgi:hypothetical protein